MTVLLHVLLFLHMVGWAIVLGSALAGLRGPTLYTGALHGALTALVTGVLMVLVQYVFMDTDRKPEPAWIATKFVLALVVTALVWLGNRRPARVNKALLGTIAGLTVVTVGVATIWR
jgi:hypothetical protein